MNIDNYISKLLFDHSCVIIPGIGGFITNDKPADYHPISHIFNPPSKSISFNSHLKKNDWLLIQSIADVENLSLKEAEIEVEKFVVVIHEKLAQDHIYKIQHVGRLSQTEEGIIRFVPDQSMNYALSSYGLSSFVAEPVIRNKHQPIKHIERTKIQTEEVKQKNRFIFLPAASILLMGFLLLQIVQLHKNEGYSIAEIFGFDAIHLKKEFKIQKIQNQSNQMNEAFIQKYRKVSNAILVDTAFKESIPKVDVEGKNIENRTTSQAKYFIVAGVFGKPEFCEPVIQDLKSKGFNATIMEQQNKYFVSVKIEKQNLELQRKTFANESGIEDAWVYRIR